MLITSQFDVSQLQKQLGSVTQTHLDQCANFGPLPLDVSTTANHNAAFNSLNR